MSYSTNTESLLFRRQFILGRCPIRELPDWKSIQFGTYHLQAHPDLEVTMAKGRKGEFILLGFILHHQRPEASNLKLMNEMAGTCQSIEMMFEYCRDLCGRYIILFSFQGKVGLLNDLIGSRSVYYCMHQNAVCCASQPSTLAKLLGIDEDRLPTVESYISKDMFASGEGRWIGDGTKYLGVKHLLPNHYLDFEEKKAVRYWPIKAVDPGDTETASRKGAVILENTMLAATNRFQMSMAITAGWDSRCMLAATRKVCSKFYFYIQKYGGMTDEHPDIKIPRNLTRKLGIPFHIIECSEYKDEAFDAALAANVFVLHNPAKKVLYKSFYRYFIGKVNASGNISDLCRSFYGIDPVREIDDLLALEQLSNSKYAVESLKEWFAEAKQSCDATGYNLRDLFFWEQNLGNWGSMFAAELDVAIDEFYPFGTRRLVEILLAVDGNQRSYNNSNVHRRIIELLWPELLAEPINPIGWGGRAGKFANNGVKHILVRLGLLSFVRSTRSKIFGQQ
ncbi:MAG: hypothetical protein JXA73_17160 [Acidobacteria bacterium]|nr:hypothetical protein [Acidobacteriota bacterium]